MQSELDANAKDREVLMIGKGLLLMESQLISFVSVERKRFEEERSSHAAFMSNYAVIKDRLDKSLQELVAVQEELNAEKRASQRLQLLREEEDRQINEVSRL